MAIQTDTAPAVRRTREQRRRKLARALAIATAAGLLAVGHPTVSSAQTPFSGATEPGLDFPLPQEELNGRRVGVEHSNALAISWDGRLLMYVDSGDALWGSLPPGAVATGFVFATFDKSKVALEGGRPNFTDCFGPPLARFATLSINAGPSLHPYPDYPGYRPTSGPAAGMGGYPDTPGTIGEIGLLKVRNLANNLYPVPADHIDPAANGENPYPSDAVGAPLVGGGHLTYDMYVTMLERPLFFQQVGAQAFWAPYQYSTTGADAAYYQPGPFSAPGATATYPNGVTRTTATPSVTMKRTGLCRLKAIVDTSSGHVVSVEVVEKFQPFELVGNEDPFIDATGLIEGVSVPTIDTMWADNNEPNLSLDGHLMVGKTRPDLVTKSGPHHITFFVNQVAFGISGWEGPYDLHEAFLKRDELVGGVKLGDRYPIARRPIKDYDGEVFGDTNGDGDLDLAEAEAAQFEGGYPWLSPDGRYIVWSVNSAGVGPLHPGSQIPDDGGGSSNRGQVSLVGSVTGWQMWRIDHEAENPSRLMFTAWDQDSRTVHQRNSSFGFGPGFWELLRGAEGLPLRDDGRTKLQLVNNQRLLYYELDLSPYQERDFGFYLPMTVMLDLEGSAPTRVVDLTRTPDLSGNANVGIVDGAQLPCEYFELPTGVTDAPGLFYGVASPTDIHPNWPVSETIVDSNGDYWAEIADWKDGKNPFGAGFTTPFEGRGDLHDMDSDACWGRVGQAMLFRKSTEVTVVNPTSPERPELNPGSSISGASSEMTLSMWVHPLQARNVKTALAQHNYLLELRPNGRLDAYLLGATGAFGMLSSPSGAIPDNTWTHVALTWDDVEASNLSEMRLYLDGVEVDADPALPFDRLQDTPTDIRIGCLNDCVGNDDAVLLLDEVALKNSALTPAEVREFALLDLPVPSWENDDLPDPPPLPFDNQEDGRVSVGSQYDADMASLGADLFHDVQLSANRRVSCATCHDPSRAFTEDLPRSVGWNGVTLLRNTPTLFNRRFGAAQFWDGRAVDLEDQALDPVFHPDEMGLANYAVVDMYLEGDADYDARFAAVGIADITEADVRRALATYMRTPVSGDSPVDRFEAGLGTLTQPQLRGRILFHGKARCSGCHNGPDFSDGRLWSTGTFRADGFDDGASRDDSGPRTAGRERFRGAFKTPTLRELPSTGPYFHDGHAADLTAVVAFYNAGGVRNDPTGGPGFALADLGHDVVAEEINRPLGLDANEVADLVAYLVALAGSDVQNPALGLNQAPTFSHFTIGPTQAPGNLGLDEVSVRVKDLDGAPDLDPGLPWTLELEVDGVVYDWSDVTTTPIFWGHKVTRTVPKELTHTARVRAADKHGKWSAWVDY